MNHGKRICNISLIFQQQITHINTLDYLPSQCFHGIIILDYQADIHPAMPDRHF